MPPPGRHLPRIVGYTLVLGVLLLIMTLLGHAVREFTKPHREISVAFPEISTLMQGDAVVEQGVPVGHVGKTGFRDGLTVTSLELHHRRPLGSDTRFLSISHSLMGARQVWIVPGNSPDPLDESVVHAGVFVPSLVDRMHEAESLVTAVAEIEQSLGGLLQADNGIASLANSDQAFILLIRDLDTLARRLALASGTWKGALQEVNAMLASAGMMTTHMEQRTDIVGIALEEHLRTFGNILSRVEATAGRLETFLETLNAPETLPGALGDVRLYNDLADGIKGLGEAVRSLNDEGVSDIRPRRR